MLDAGSLVVVVEVVVLEGGSVVEVVEVVVVVDAPGAITVGGGTKVQKAVAQSGCDASTTSTPGTVENVHTFNAGPLWRQDRAGSVVAKSLMVPRYTAWPSEAGGVAGVSVSLVPSQTPVEVKPEPAGPGGAVVDDVLVLVGPDDRSLTAGALPRSAASMAGSFPSMPSAQIPRPAMWNDAASWAFSASDVGSSK